MAPSSPRRAFYLQAGGLPGLRRAGRSAAPSRLCHPERALDRRCGVELSKVAAYRAPGPIGAFAVESVLDEIAEKLGLDPLDMRVRNSAKAGDKAIYGPTFGAVTFVETIDAIRKHPHYRAPLDRNPRPGVKRGRGVASGLLVQCRRRILGAGEHHRGRQCRRHHRAPGYRRQPRVDRQCGRRADRRRSSRASA